MADLGGDFARALESVRERIGIGNKRGDQGVKAEVSGHQVAISVTIMVEFGHVVLEVARQVQANVARQTQRMLGLSVVEVNVTVDDVRTPRPCATRGARAGRGQPPPAWPRAYEGVRGRRAPPPGSPVDGVVGGAPQVLHGVGTPRSPPRRRAPGSAAGVAGRRPRPRAAGGTPRSVAGRRRGPRGPAWRPWRRSTARCRVGRRAPPRRRRGRCPPPGRAWPSASARASASTVARRLAGMARTAGSTAATAAGVGNRWVSPPSGSSTGSPPAATSRAARVPAAATVTCWPSTILRAISAGSTVPGMRRPGAAATGGPAGRRPGLRRRRRDRRRGRGGAGRRRRRGEVGVGGHPEPAGDVVSPGASATTPGPDGSRSVRRSAPPRHSSTRGPPSPPGGRTGCRGHSGGRKSRRSSCSTAPRWRPEPVGASRFVDT